MQLAVDVADADVVQIHQTQTPHPGAGQGLHHPRPHAPDAHHHHVGGTKTGQRRRAIQTGDPSKAKIKVTHDGNAPQAKHSGQGTPTVDPDPSAPGALRPIKVLRPSEPFMDPLEGGPCRAHETNQGTPVSSLIDAGCPRPPESHTVQILRRIRAPANCGDGSCSKPNGSPGCWDHHQPN